MKILTLKQQGPDWLQARCGRVTASRCADVMDVLKRGGESADHAAYRREVAGEILTGVANDNYVSKDMARGSELEPLARAAYEFATDTEVDQVGFVQHAAIELYGASPDGICGSDGGVELKVPRVTTHIKWALAGVIPEEHKWQCIAGMDCCERDWWDFASYCPNMPKHMQIFKVRLYRDQAEIDRLQAGVRQFLDEVQDTIHQLEQRFGKAPLRQALKASLEDGLITDDDIRLVDPAWMT
jgi:hypothetical protein